MIKEEYRGKRQWSRDKQAVFTVIWISFLCAAVGTMVFFAVFDPADLSGALDQGLETDRDTWYAAGFFFFWLFAVACSAITAFLVRTAPRRDAAHRDTPD